MACGVGRLESVVVVVKEEEERSSAPKADEKEFTVSSIRSFFRM